MFNMLSDYSCNVSEKPNKTFQPKLHLNFNYKIDRIMAWPKTCTKIISKYYLPIQHTNKMADSSGSDDDDDDNDMVTKKHMF